MKQLGILLLFLLPPSVFATIGDLGWAMQPDLEGYYRVDIGPLSPDEAPTCDTTYASAAAATNWATVLANYSGDDVVCLDPDDYSAFGLFTPASGDSGASAGAPNFLFCTQGLTPWSETGGNRCKIEGIEFDDVDNFAVMGFDMDSDGSDTDNIVSVSGDSDDVSIVNNWIHDGGRNLMSWGRGSDNGIIQDNVICEGELIGSGGTERHAIFLAGGNDQGNATLQGATNLRIISNEMCNVPGDIIQIHPSTAQGVGLAAAVTYAGLRIIDNEFYFSNTRYMLLNGTYDTDGAYMAAENCIDTKMIIPRGDAPTESEKAIIAYNICHGTRKTNSGFLDNLESAGTGFFHQRDQSSWTYVYGNIWYDDTAGIGMEDNLRDFEIDYNAFFNVTIQDQTAKGIISPDNETGSVGITFRNNNLFSTDATCSTNADTPTWMKHAASKIETITLNTIVNGCVVAELNGGDLTTDTCGDNYYFGNGATGSTLSGQAILEDEPQQVTCSGIEDIDKSTVPSAQDFKFDRFRKTGRETVTITGGFLTRDTAPTAP